MHPHVIPRPKGAKRRYRNPDMIPGLSTAERVLLRKRVPPLAFSYVDRNLPWRLQDPNALAEMIQECTRQFPFLRRYEDSWPLEIYLKTRMRLGRFREYKNVPGGKKQLAPSRIPVATNRYSTYATGRADDYIEDECQDEGFCEEVLDTKPGGAESTSGTARPDMAFSQFNAFLETVRGLSGAKKVKININLEWEM